MELLDDLVRVHESTTSDFYVKTDPESGKKYLYKIIKSIELSPEKKLELNNEFSILQKINADGIRKLIDKTSINDRPALILEFIEGRTIKELVKAGGLDFESIYKAAIQIAQTLDAIHNQNIIHKDISSNNILHDKNDNRIKIIDFGISTRTNLRNEAAPNINKLEGTLAYLSPEQTGRMNRSVDYRTDFYSLGAVLYEMSTGVVPFDFEDSLQMVYAHLAKEIFPASKKNPECPVSLCDIISRLMNKNAEDRYQSAKGLLFDLNLSYQLFKLGKTDEKINIGSKDHSGVFLIPEKTYGRSTENQQLLDIFDKVANGNVELVLVEGPSGTGKSRLVAEVNKPITNKRGFFISGKFDQLQKDLPYSAFVQAFESLVKLLLSESEESQEKWKEKILSNIGGNGQLLTDIIPKLELLIGKQPELAALEGVASQNRFEYTLKQFVLAFCKSDHPLVLFLDDLQWVDQSSLRLVEMLLNDMEVSHLMLICSYRDNEVSLSHPFYKLTEKLRADKNNITTISLSNLTKENLNELLCDAFLATENKIAELSELIYSKSKGNIFFVHQFLNSLKENNLLEFDHETTSWIWDVKKIGDLKISDNIVELMMNRIALLPSNTVALLSSASCIGNSFDLHSLISISGKTVQDISSALEPAIENGLLTSSANITHLSNSNDNLNIDEYTFRFVHDRVQQTFYLNLNEAQKRESHLNIGKLLLKNASEAQLNSGIFEIVNHLNLGAAEYEVSPQYNLCELNVKAAQKARNSAAFEIALQYFQKALEKLPENAWKTQYKAALDLHNGSAECAYLSGEMTLMESLVKTITTNATSILDQAFSYEVRINAYNAQNELLKQVMIGVEAVNKLGVKIPSKANKLHVVKELIAIKLALRGKKIESLADLPEMSDANIAAAHSIMTKIGSAAMYAAPDLLPVIAFRSTLLSIKYGNTVNSAFSYTGYAMILCGALGDIENGFKFGEVALTLSSRTTDANKKVRPEELFYSSIAHWKKPYRSAIEPLYNAYRMGVESGDFEFASYSINNYLFSKYFAGCNLYELNEENEEYVQVVKSKLRHKTAFYHGGVYAQAVYNLIVPSVEPWILKGPFYSEAESLPKHKEAGDIAMLCMSYYNKFTLAYYYGDYAKASEYAAICKKHLEGSISQPNVNLYYFYSALAQLAQNKTDGVASALRKLKTFAQFCPENFKQKFLLVSAELARVEKKYTQAEKLYNKAIELSRKHQFKNDEALSYELLSRHYLTQGNKEVGSYMLSKSLERYSEWGAMGKVAHLKEQFSGSLSVEKVKSFGGGGTISATKSNTDSLDLESIMKASQSLSEEIKLDKLIVSLMSIVFENAGAQHGALILQENKKWMIQAIGKPDNLTIYPGISINDLNESGNTYIPVTYINYVLKTKEFSVIGNALESNFQNDPYFQRNQSKSILCVPLLNNGKLVGVIYLENNLTTDTFTRERIDTLNLLSSQIAISLENASLYNNMEEKVKERTSEVMRQKEIIEKKNKSITDSINYAKRIQEAVLPDVTKIRHGVQDAFIFFKPRDIVSGDFYWFAEKDGKLLIAAVDCTGHGVPGGFMSMVGHTLIQQMVFERGIMDAGEILTHLNLSIRKELKQDSGTNKDGMDLALIIIDKQTKTVEFSGAKNPLVIIQNNQVEFIRGDKFPIGGSEHGKDHVYTKSTFTLDDNTYLYLYSDGYEDQLGGPEGRKFGRTRMMELLMSIHQKPFEEQKNICAEKHMEWRGKENQLDDLLLMGIKV